MVNFHWALDLAMSYDLSPGEPGTRPLAPWCGQWQRQTRVCCTPLSSTAMRSLHDRPLGCSGSARSTSLLSLGILPTIRLSRGLSLRPKSNQVLGSYELAQVSSYEFLTSSRCVRVRCAPVFVGAYECRLTHELCVVPL